MDEFTGERVIPGEVEVDLWNEHVSRYTFAAQFASGRRVLDIGCGTGYGAAELSRHAISVTGIDISPDAVAYARQHYPYLQLTAASAASLPLQSCAFQLVTAFEVIEHLEDWQSLVREAHRVLADDGILVISTPNKNYYTESRGAEGHNPFHVHEFEAAEFEDALSSVFPNVVMMLQNRSEAFVFYPPHTFWDVAARLDSSGGTDEQAHFFVALCSKRPIERRQTFVYVPRAANVMREREEHIRLLEGELELNRQWLDQTRNERTQLLQALASQKAHLEEQNQWALGLEREWKAAQQHIVELHQSFAAEQKATREGYETKVAELEQDSRDKADWAIETERRLSREVEQLKAQIGELARLLDAADVTITERSTWAQGLQNQLSQTQAQLDSVRASRWLRTGRMFGVGPEL